MMLSKRLYDKLVVEVDTTDTNMTSTSRLVTKTKYDFYK